MAVAGSISGLMHCQNRQTSQLKPRLTTMVWGFESILDSEDLKGKQK